MKAFTEDSILLAIETSCDETAAAVFRGEQLLANVISSQVVHAQYGGVVPELASRAHVQTITFIVRKALEQAGVHPAEIDGIAVTNAPGLIGALVVGTNFAKGLAVRWNIPVVPVNHIEGHIYSPFLEHHALAFPYLALIVSGGHTLLALVYSFEHYEVLGTTRDDAAGEAFDKIAKMLGLGYPGGPEIDRHARKGNPHAYQFPRSLIHTKNFEFSFSGLKTAVRGVIQRHQAPLPESLICDICASAQEAIVDVLVAKTLKAARKFGIARIVVAGGVSANSRLRERFEQITRKEGLQVFIPSMEYCTDNAAMIGLVGRYKLLHHPKLSLQFLASPTFVPPQRQTVSSSAS